MDNNNQEKIKCDSCGKCQELQKFKLKKKSKRFCSQECLKMLDNNSKTGQTDKKNGKNWVSIRNLINIYNDCVLNYKLLKTQMLSVVGTLNNLK